MHCKKVVKMLSLLLDIPLCIYMSICTCWWVQFIWFSQFVGALTVVIQLCFN